MKTRGEPVRTIGFSLGSKLNIQLWFRLVGIFLILNICFLGAAFSALILNAEHTAAEFLQITKLPLTETDGAFSALSIRSREGEAKGLVIPSNLKGFFPEETAQARRSLLLPRADDVPFYNLFDHLQYRLDLTIGQDPYTILINFSPFVRILKNVFIVLVTVQIFLALRSALTRADLIKKVLEPISELAEQARSLSSGRGPLTLEEMEALAGTLDEINAARLDTRIDLSSTQDELKNVAIAINGLLDRINDSYRSQIRFVSDASHELRSPIAAIQGYANLLDRWGKHDAEALQESIEAIKEEAGNMKELVEQLLFLARGDNHTMALQKERFDLGTVGRALHREAQMVNDSHDFRLEAEEACVFGDQGLIKQAGRILMDNAVKYTPEGGQITLSVISRDNKAKLTVQDTGIGIAPKAIPHIFERFYRADDSRARATGGTGLGLSIAKWIAERHGGYLEVLSREGFGSKISVVLPLSKKN